MRKSAAWAVHLLTATGAVAGLLALIAITQGRYKAAFGWMALTLAIDSIDGALARAVRVKQVLPGFDGSLLDNIVDYFTYVIVPAFFIYEAGIVPAKCGVLAAVAITLASGYQFCQTDAKTDDHFFRGFPSYWNIVAFYLFLMPFPRWLNLAILILLGIAVFVPAKYLYPSRTLVLRRLTLALTALWGGAMLIVLLRYPDGHKPWIYGSLVYVVYYFAVSFYFTLEARWTNTDG